MKCRLVLSLLILFFFLFFTPTAHAETGSVLGIHILSPSEAPQARELLRGNGLPDQWHFLTIPLTLNDLDKKAEWQVFFDYAKEQKLIPIVRLSTRPENGAWAVPKRADVVKLFAFLSSLNWPSQDRYVIAFNEVNHAKEWGNSIDPAGYADMLRFTSDWAHTEEKHYKVLPAAMDLAAPNGRETKEAFTYLNEMQQADADIFSTVDYWNSHSYPNPGFSSSPYQTGKGSLRGYQTELSYLKEKANLDLKTFITETGWVDTKLNRRWLSNYYLYATQNIWNDDRIVAVTPFVLQGAPGPFTEFTFLDQYGKPTSQYRAYQDAMKQLAEKK